MRGMMARRGFMDLGGKNPAVIDTLLISTEQELSTVIAAVVQKKDSVIEGD